MKLKNILLASTLALSVIVPSADVFATGEYIDIATVSGSSIHVEGGANSGTIAVALTVYEDDTKATKLAGPETTNVKTDGTYSYDITGSFSADKTYYVCTADFNGGVENCASTVKVINSINVTVKPPKIGDKVTLVDQGGYDWPDKEANASVSNDGVSIEMAVWTDENGDFFEGEFEANNDYYAFLDLLAPNGYVFANNLTVNLNGGGVVSNTDVWPGQNGVGLTVKIKPTVDGEELKATIANTGVAPKQSDTKDIATKNISLGTSIAVASAILYGLHLFITHKKNA